MRDETLLGRNEAWLDEYVFKFLAFVKEKITKHLKHYDMTSMQKLNIDIPNCI